MGQNTAAGHWACWFFSSGDCVLEALPLFRVLPNRKHRAAELILVTFAGFPIAAVK